MALKTTCIEEVSLHGFMRPFLFIAALAAVSMVSMPSMAQDLKITLRVNTSGKQMIQPEVQYHSQRYSRINYEWDKRDFLVDYQDSVVYDVEHRKKTVTKYTFGVMENQWRKAREVARSTKMEMPEVARIMGDPDLISVKKTTDTVAGRECEKYEITVGKFICFLYVDTGFEPFADRDASMRAWGVYLRELLMFPTLGATFTNCHIERTKIRGVILKEEWRFTARELEKIPGATHSSEAISVDEGPLPASVFELPPRYKREDGKILVSITPYGASKGR